VRYFVVKFGWDIFKNKKVMAKNVKIQPNHGILEQSLIHHENKLSLQSNIYAGNY